MTPSTLKPGSTLNRFRKLASRSPDPISSTKVNATSATTEHSADHLSFASSGSCSALFMQHVAEVDLHELRNGNEADENACN